LARTKHRHGDTTQSGIGSTNIGARRFIDQEQNGFSMSIYPQFEFRTSAASFRKGLVESGPELRLPIEISREFEKVTIDGELGYQLVPREKDEWIYGVAVAHKVDKRLELVGEIHGESRRDLTENEIVFNVGGRYNLNKRYTLLLSSGRSLHTSSDQPPWIAYTGLQLHF
jgi:Putative MetA-pathway of phenol degradation